MENANKCLWTKKKNSTNMNQLKALLFLSSELLNSFFFFLIYLFEMKVYIFDGSFQNILKCI